MVEKADAWFETGCSGLLRLLGELISDSETETRLIGSALIECSGMVTVKGCILSLVFCLKASRFISLSADLMSP